MDEAGQWLGLVLCVPFIILTLMVGWQEGYLSCKKLCFANIQELCSRTGGGGELADQGSPGKMAVK